MNPTILVPVAFLITLDAFVPTILVAGYVIGRSRKISREVTTLAILAAGSASVLASFAFVDAFAAKPTLIFLASVTTYGYMSTLILLVFRWYTPFGAVRSNVELPAHSTRLRTAFPPVAAILVSSITAIAFPISSW